MGRKRLPKLIRQTLAERANKRCEYCQSRSDCACESFEGGHVLPFAAGGSDDLSNLAHTCRGCNSRLSDRTHAPDPATGLTVPIFHPRKDKWKDHFAWDEAYLNIIGLTPIGRATVEALQLNREGVVNLRKLMKLGGIHPPPTEEEG